MQFELDWQRVVSKEEFQEHVAAVYAQQQQQQLGADTAKDSGLSEELEKVECE